jgi:23S rRNA pseudouridine2457 synthase
MKANVILLHKPYGVICQFSPHERHPTLKTLIQNPGFYPAGRLDTDSEGLLVLSSDGALQHQIAHPYQKMLKTYWVQVEGVPTELQLEALRLGVQLKDFKTAPAKVELLPAMDIAPRNPPIRMRLTVPDTWLAMTISEGKNRQVRRMTASVGLPTLRLIRVAVGPWRLEGLAVSESRALYVDRDQLKTIF